MAEVEATFLDPLLNVGNAHTNILRSVSRQQEDRVRELIRKA